MQSNPMAFIKAKKSKAKLHKPDPNIKEILYEVKLFNDFAVNKRTYLEGLF